MVSIPSLSSSFVVRNISGKDIRILGRYNLRRSTQADLFIAVPNITEAELIEDLRSGDLNRELNIKNSLQLISYSSPYFSAATATHDNDILDRVDNVVASSVNVDATDVPVTPLSTLSISASGLLFDLAIGDNILYAIENSATAGVPTLIAVDVTNPAAPINLGSVSIGIGARAVCVSGSYVLVTGDNSTGRALQVFNAVNPASMSLASSITHGAASQAMAVAGSTLLLGGGNAFVAVYDIDDPTSPRLLGNLGTGSGTPRGLALSGRRALIADKGAGTFKIFDLTNPASPSSISSVTTGVDSRCVCVLGKYAYLGDATNNTLTAIDMSLPASPTIATVSTVTAPNKVACQGTRLAIGGTNAIDVFDLTNPMAPVLLKRIDVDGIVKALVMDSGNIFAITATSVVTYQLSDNYIQQLGAGRITTDHAKVNGLLTVGGDVQISGGLSVGGVQLRTGVSAYKTADESVTSSTTRQNDDHLTLTLGPSARYAFKFSLFLTNAGGTAGIRLAIGGTVTFANLKAQVSVWDDVTNSLVTFSRITAFDTDQTASLSAGSGFAVIEGTIETSAAGTFLLKWAQTVSDASATTIERGSSLWLTRI
jgi:hypothetical protein